VDYVAAAYPQLRNISCVLPGQYTESGVVEFRNNGVLLATGRLRLLNRAQVNSATGDISVNAAISDINLSNDVLNVPVSPISVSVQENAPGVSGAPGSPGVPNAANALGWYTPAPAPALAPVTASLSDNIDDQQAPKCGDCGDNCICSNFEVAEDSEDSEDSRELDSDGDMDSVD
jgi:hypothetical protein